MASRLPALAGAMSIALAGCTDRDRPLPVAPIIDLELRADVVSPRTHQLVSVVAGSTMAVHIFAEEAGGNLHGVGFVALRPGVEGPPIDSAVVDLEPRREISRSFALRIPENLPHNAQINIYGIAVGPNTVSVRSPPQAVMVARCTPGAVWC